MAQYTPPICVNCKHYNESRIKLNCKAFSELIPFEIINGDNNHTEPLPDQENDIVFESIKE